MFFIRILPDGTPDKAFFAMGPVELDDVIRKKLDSTPITPSNKDNWKNTRWIIRNGGEHNKIKCIETI